MNVDCAELGVIRLRSFESNFIPARHMTSLERFFMSLAGNSHPLAIHLKQIRIAVDVYHQLHLRFMDALVAMLAQNRVLTTVTLCINDRSHTGRQENAILERLSNTPPAQESRLLIEAPVGMKGRVAFLSVVNSRRAVGSAMGQLDSSLVSAILDFAVHRFTRTVDLVYEGPAAEVDIHVDEDW